MKNYYELITKIHVFLSTKISFSPPFVINERMVGLKREMMTNILVNLKLEVVVVEVVQVDVLVQWIVVLA